MGAIAPAAVGLARCGSGARRGDLQRCDQFFGLVSKFSFLEPGAAAAMSVCGTSSQWERSLLLLRELQLEGLLPSLVTLNAAISCCEKGGAWECALALVSESSAASLRPDVISFSAAIGACGRCIQWAAALSLFSGLVASSLAPNSLSYGAAVSAVERAGSSIPPSLEKLFLGQWEWRVAFLFVALAFPPGGGGADPFSTGRDQMGKSQFGGGAPPSDRGAGDGSGQQQSFQGRGGPGNAWGGPSRGPAPGPLANRNLRGG
ncbi:unnamed protein product, partial [Polarella glacialis]